MSPPRDHEARRRAATDFTTNLVVSAGAGTGKTTLIVERILTAIGSAAAPLPRIAAITFTEKAAGEMSDRLARELRVLSHLARGGAVAKWSAAVGAYASLTETFRVPPATIAVRAAEAEAAVDRASVSTIHGFCAELLRAHPLAAGLAPGFTIDRGPAGRRLAAAEWPAFLEEELGPAGRRVRVWERLVSTFRLPALLDLGRALASGAVSESALREGPRRLDLHAALSGPSQDLADAIRTAVDETPELTDAPRRWLSAAEGALRTFAASGTTAAQHLIEAFDGLTDAMPTARRRSVTPERADAIESLASRARAILKAVAVYDAGVERDLLDALIPFAQRLRARQTRAGLVDFDGLLVRARDLLRDAPHVRARLKARYDMLLVDEFQDTDPIQYEIVFFLGERPDDESKDAYGTRLATGKVFIVGDAKQSIYRFRGADYAATQQAVGHVLSQGGVELTLSSSFRSSAAVLRAVNAFFAEPLSLLWRSSDCLPPYVPIDAERGGGEPHAVQVWTTTAGPKSCAAERRRAEGLALAAEIPKLAGPGKPYRFEDVLVLFRGFSDLAPYLRALREAAIPFVVTGGRTFYERTEIVQAIAVLRAVADPDDAVATLAFRRSPAGGVPDTELYVAATGSGAPTPALDASDRRLDELRAEAVMLPVGAAVRHVLEASGLLALSGLAFEGAQRVANLEKLQLAADELSHDGRLSLIETIDELEEAFTFDEEGDSPLADAGRDAVRVMTIHGAKGLEAKIVILADTAGGRSNLPPRHADARMTRLPYGEFLRIDAPAFCNAASLVAGLEDARHDAAEDVRLLYVALTRAKDRLIVFGGASSRSPWSAAIEAWTTGVTHRQADAAGPTVTEKEPPPIGATAAVARYEAAIDVVRKAGSEALRSPSDTGGREGEPGSTAAPDFAREVGRIVHARLAGLPSDATGPEADAAAAILDAPAGAALRARLATLAIVAREIPMLLAQGDVRWRGTIDLLYRDADGRLVVADFKTDASDEGAIERHRTQLRVYADAVSRTLAGERVRAELWMLRSGNVLEV